MAHHPDPRVDEILSRFDIRVDEYTPQSIVTALRGSWQLPSEGRFVEVLLRPAFHAELLLVMHERPDGTVLWASTAQTNLHSWQPDPFHPNHDPELRPALVTATTWLDPQTSHHLWVLAGAVTQPEKSPGIGLDGVSVDLRVRLRNEVTPVHAWCPPPGSSIGALLDALGHEVSEMPTPFPAVVSAAGL